MIKVDEDALICDLAETYGIYNYRMLPPSTVAVLAVGLRDNSRIKLKINKSSASLEQILLASICDRLGFILYSLGGGKGTKPKSIAEMLMAQTSNHRNTETMIFRTAEDFEKARAKLLKGDDINGN